MTSRPTYTHGEQYGRSAKAESNSFAGYGLPMTQQPPPQPAYIPPAPQQPITPKGLAIAALVVGIVAFLFGLAPVFGAIAGVAAVVLGVIALVKKQPKGLALTGLILGAAAILASFAMTIGVVVLAASSPRSSSSTTVTAPAEEPEKKPVPEKSEATPKPTAEPEPESTPAPAPAALDETHAAQFLAYAWEDRFPYGGSVHWIMDRITTDNGDGTFTFKIGATIKNEYGTKMSATIEGDVGGTNDAPVILDSILYTSTGEIISYH